MFITINDCFSQTWQRFLLEDDESKKQYNFCELMNLFEISCALHHEGSIVGVSGKLMKEYLIDTLKLIDGNEDAVREFRRTASSVNTYKYILCFIKAIPEKDRPNRLLF